jgi:hypothetical protein
MEQLKKGDLIISKGRNFVIVELVGTVRNENGEQELYDFVDDLIDKGYDIIDSRRIISRDDGYTSLLFDERWVLKSPK